MIKIRKVVSNSQYIIVSAQETLFEVFRIYFMKQLNKFADVIPFTNDDQETEKIFNEFHFFLIVCSSSSRIKGIKSRTQISKRFTLCGFTLCMKGFKKQITIIVIVYQTFFWGVEKLLH